MSTNSSNSTTVSVAVWVYTTRWSKCRRGCLFGTALTTTTPLKRDEPPTSKCHPYTLQGTHEELLAPTLKLHEILTSRLLSNSSSFSRVPSSLRTPWVSHEPPPIYELHELLTSPLLSSSRFVFSRAPFSPTLTFPGPARRHNEASPSFCDTETYREKRKGARRHRT